MMPPEKLYLFFIVVVFTIKFILGTIELRWSIGNENDELSIMASTGGNTVTPSYKGIISTIEYV